MTLEGPMNRATRVSSVAAFRESFGDIAPSSPVSIAVLQFFSNGGRTAVVVRASAGTSDRAREQYAEIIGDLGRSTGVHALGKSPSVDLMVTPDLSVMGVREHAAVVKSVVAYCEEHRIFYILDAPLSRSKRDPVKSMLEWVRRSAALRNPNVALYFPLIRMSNPSRRSCSISASATGAIAGLYARMDFQQGIWQAPAGTKAGLLGISDVEIGLSESDMGQLKDAGINALRSFPGCGIVAWGARTFTANGEHDEWKYVPVRRLFIFLQRSIHQGLQWTVFEPNGESLWAEIRLSISSFLNQLFRRGAFVGGSTREAYFVKCGGDTMTSNDIQAGRVVALVGFAPLKPAEFVVLRVELRAA
jgi:Bacteriophage tail sheath protein